MEGGGVGVAAVPQPIELAASNETFSRLIWRKDE
jgi:hypothetical protein